MTNVNTKKHKEDVAKALRAVKAGKAYHWPTIAAILADEVGRLQEVLEEVERNKGFEELERNILDAQFQIADMRNALDKIRFIAKEHKVRSSGTTDVVFADIHEIADQTLKGR